MNADTASVDIVVDTVLVGLWWWREVHTPSPPQIVVRTADHRAIAGIQIRDYHIHPIPLQLVLWPQILGLKTTLSSGGHKMCQRDVNFAP